MDTLTRNKITYTNLILSISIIFHHAYNLNVYSLEGTLLSKIEYFLLEIFEISVPLFFLLSAFLFYQNLTNDNIIAKLKSRIFSLVIPYLAWNLVGYLYFQFVNLIPFIRNNYSGEISDFSFIEMLKQCVIGDYNLVTWFLGVLIIYTFINPLIYHLSKSKIVANILLVLSFLLCLLPRNNITVNYCFYYIGIYLALYKKEWFLKSNLKKTVCLFMLLTILFSYIYFRIEYCSVLGRVLYSTLSILLWKYFDVLRKDVKTTWWFSYTIFFYCCHEFILEPIEKIIYILIGNNLIGAAIDFVFAPIITFLIMVVILSVIKKIPFLFKVLTGFRKEK